MTVHELVYKTSKSIYKTWFESEYEYWQKEIIVDINARLEFFKEKLNECSILKIDGHTH